MISFHADGKSIVSGAEWVETQLQKPRAAGRNAACHRMALAI